MQDTVWVSWRSVNTLVRVRTEADCGHERKSKRPTKNHQNREAGSVIISTSGDTEPSQGSRP